MVFVAHGRTPVGNGIHDLAIVQHHKLCGPRAFARGPWSTNLVRVVDNELSGLRANARGPLNHELG